MALPRVHKTIQDSLGNVVPQVQCSVYNEGTGVLATLWQDDAGTIPLPNPMISSTNYGSIDFYVAPGHFDLTFVKSGYTFETLYDMQVPQDDLTLGTLAQQDASAVAITGGSVTNLTTLTALGDVLVGGQLFAQNLNVTANAGVQGNLTLTGTSQFGNNIGLWTAPVANIVIGVRYAKASRYGIVLQPSDSDTGTATAMSFNNLAGTPVGSIATTGAATAYNTTSDGRLKGKIQELLGGVDAIKRMRPVSYVWNSTDEPDIGFLAHELMTVAPNAVQGLPDEVNPDGTIKPQQADQSKLIPLLTSAIKELLAQVEALTARVTSMETALGV